MKLPQDFKTKIEQILDKKECEEFFNTYLKHTFTGLRVNTLKTSVEDFLKICEFNLTSIPWTSDGFYYNDVIPSRHAYYYAGLYYIQEPSAMFPGFLIDAKPGEKILDLCAAPGGKSVQIASGMKGKGILVSNDISPKRIKALVKNVELCGVRNCIITNDIPENLASKFGFYFDKILVDAPCSGEGMFRKDKEALRSWSKYKSQEISQIQKEILKSAHKMLKPGGRIVYSTCTFSREENEEVIEWFMSEFGDYEVIKIPKQSGIVDGIYCNNIELSKAARLWPHKINGEGHFAVVLQKKSGEEKYEQDEIKGISKQQLPIEFSKFEEENLNYHIEGEFYFRGKSLYCMPQPVPDLSGINVIKHGWYLGNFNQKKFEPSHSLCMALKARDFKNVINLDLDSVDIFKYLKGETLIRDGQKGLKCICVDGFSLGFAKQIESTLKNLYPQGWRMMR